jgi:hypothetical protein
MQVSKRPIPYRLGSNSTVLWWETTDSGDLTGHGLWVQVPAQPEIYYAANTRMFTRDDGVKVASHSVELNNLTADTVTTVRVAGPGYLGTVRYSFEHPAANDDVSFMVMNNVEGNYTDLEYLLAEKHVSANAVIGCGDLVDLGDRLGYSEWARPYLSLYNFLENAKGVVLSAFEKGKTSTGSSLIPSSPKQSPYYASTVGPCRFISLDTSRSGRKSLAAGGSQMLWLLNEVKSDDWKNASFRIIIGNQPPVTGLWADDGTYLNGKDAFLSSNLLPLIKSSGAHMCIFGGGHSYQRGILASNYESFEDLPIHYIICSGFNSPHTKEVGKWSASSDPSFLIQSSDRHYVRLDVSLDKLTLIAREWSSDAIIDQVSLSDRKLD